MLKTPQGSGRVRQPRNHQEEHHAVEDPQLWSGSCLFFILVMLKKTFPLSSRFVQNIQVPQLFQVYHASAQPIAAGEKLYYQSTIKLWISTHLI